MPAAGRLGDKAKVPRDSHGCPACPHPATGPAVAGSPDVNVNGRAALRVGDSGIHAACCGANTWNASRGAPDVFINGKAAYRMGDPSTHCGGSGKLVEGSSNVFIGDQGWSLPVSYEGGFLLVDEEGKPLAHWEYVIYTESGQEIHGTSDEEGKTQMIRTDRPEKLECELIGQPCQC